ncbi:MAG: ATP-dependent DNA helicase RecG [Candidatus Dormibacteraceae bacterium]
MASLDTSVSELPKVRAPDLKAFARLGIATYRDLLLALPFGWETYGEPVAVADLRPGVQATVVGTLASVGAKRTFRRKLALTEAVLIDTDGGRLNLVWFNQPFIARQLERGDRLAVAGLPRLSGYGTGFEMQNPHHERLARHGGGPHKVGGLMPKYRLSAPLSSRRLAAWVEPLLPLAAGLEETIPEAVRNAHRIPGIAEAVEWGHRPKTESESRRAQYRMAFAELFELQLAFLQHRRELQGEKAKPIPYSQAVIEAFKAGLEFQLTDAQRRTTWEVFKDLALATPMNRLLNGDVGAGKTAVAAAAVAMTHAAGLQSIVMAPTEILARQHLHKFRAYLETSFPDLRVDLLVSGLPAAERRRVSTSVASGHTALLVGTHALIVDNVEIPDLGLAVVDEQHRFGTRQRELLRAKGRGRPHFLAMTATPIPRTLALAMYGDMTVSVLDQLPPGRTSVATSVITPDGRQAAYALVRREVAAGRQVFIICPFVEESETLEVKAATAEFERLRRDVFPDLRLALVHGRMRDKDAAMRQFASGASDILVATPVVEVGVDVPNATVMLIEGAERFGLAQLHQFRGRVGRGNHLSHCLLLVDEPSEKTLERLELVAAVNDGFRLAAEDMRLRGAGELMGSRQHGLSDRAMQELLHPVLLNEVRAAAEKLLESDPTLASHPALAAAVERRMAGFAIN